MVELLKQGQYVPQPVEQQVVIVYAGTKGYVDGIPVDSIGQYERDLFRHIDSDHPDIWTGIREKKVLKGELEDKLNEVLKAFTDKFVPSAEDHH